MCASAARFSEADKIMSATGTFPVGICPGDVLTLNDLLGELGQFSG